MTTTSSDTSIPCLDVTEPLPGWSKFQKLQSDAGRLLIYTLLIGGSIIMLLPFIWGFSSSFKNTGEIFNYPPQLIPKVFHFENYTSLLRMSDLYGSTNFQLWFFNSALITVCRVILVLFFDSLAG